VVEALTRRRWWRWRRWPVADGHGQGARCTSSRVDDDLAGCGVRLEPPVVARRGWDVPPAPL